MKRCWDNDALKRPSSNEVSNIIEKWIILPYKMKIEDIDEELKHDVMEFINAPSATTSLNIVNTAGESSTSTSIERNNSAAESHPQACYTSRLLNFTSENVNEILKSESLDHCITKDLVM
ncbi:kinase-like domain-containing protein [Rhizophagus clarus]|nr:kinase-like domain-containing protein [Rhizophagus clarus]